jgi:seryl-tRNA synthetase
MFDIKWIRDNSRLLDEGLARRGMAPVAAVLLELDSRHRAAQTQFQTLQQQRNEASRSIGDAKKKGENAEAAIKQVAQIKEQIRKVEDEMRRLARELDDRLSGLPNLPAPDVPDGADESANIVLRSWGEPPAFDFEPLEHFDIGEALGMMNFDAAAKLAGARFVILSGGLARLERALAAFMLDLHTLEHGYREVSPPVMVRDEALFGTGQLPKFAEELFRTTNGYWLIPTAEVPLTNLVAGQIVDEADLPLRFTALTPCFRSEAGAAGKDTRGMMRQHQFLKVELVSITHPDCSDDEHEALTRAAEEVLKRLELPYRVVALATGDMGFAAAKTYDLEVWLPGQGRYREVSSCSNCGDFQARRMKARFRQRGEKGTRFVHSLNGSGLAVGRTLIALLENHQRADGSVAIPEALRPYMGGETHIGGDA